MRVLRSIDVVVCPGKEGKGVPAGHDADDETRLLKVNVKRCPLFRNQVEYIYDLSKRL